MKVIFTWAQAGKLEKTVKSEPVPASNNGPVKVLVAEQFDELVTNSGKFVLIEFYAPWCGHCQSLAPVYEQARSCLLLGARSFSHKEFMVVARALLTAEKFIDRLNIYHLPWCGHCQSHALVYEQARPCLPRLTSCLGDVGARTFSVTRAYGFAGREQHV